MATLTRTELQSLRRFWRAIPSDAATAHPNLRSRVSLEENGSLIAISEQSGRFSINPLSQYLTFDVLDGAELFAAGMLFERLKSGRT